MKPERLTITDRLFAHPEHYDFFQSVRLLEAINNEKTHTQPGWHQYPVGYDYAQKKELVQFKVDPALKYPKGKVSKLQEPTFSAEKNRLTAAVMHVTFMGLTGPSGALPAHYSESILEENRAKNYALADFFDLFNHRAISLYYRGWEKYQVQYSFERKRRQHSRDDTATKILSHLVGIGTGATAHQHIVNDDSFLFYAGLMANKRKTAHGLESMLSDYFAVPVKIKQFLGSWNRLNDSECSRTPSKDLPNGQFNRLGKDTVLGKRVWFSQGKFRIILGPLNAAQYQDFLPGSIGLQKLKELVKNYVGPQFGFDIQLISEPQNVPECHLDSINPPRLGYFTWLKGKEHKIQHDQLILV